MKRKIFYLLLIYFCFASCKTGVRPQNESLKESWYKYWYYKKQGEFKKAFYYEHLSLSPKRTPEKYVKGMANALTVKKFELIEIGKKGSGPMGSTPIKMRLVTDWPPIFNLKGDRVIVINDYWIKKNNRWYHLRRGLTGFW